ncbi:hypothetical protein CYMTET_39042 [Cymbomonas tetramitiformis]|uniref:Right handed beta helix domain-containing protein n=1 Tax=Cymbomonas tetramitiformis TaxID=36881 RepID=A0AAE0CAU9_9CHLO|nr:hypothetical protein CYMTET_39042 [Cymbomonas tetramitiformis]|eukprot:gene22599-27278_t
MALAYLYLGQSINAKIAELGEGATIELEPGVYRESIRLEKSVHIRASSRSGDENPTHIIGEFGKPTIVVATNTPCSLTGVVLSHARSSYSGRQSRCKQEAYACVVVGPAVEVEGTEASIRKPLPLKSTSEWHIHSASHKRESVEREELDSVGVNLLTKQIPGKWRRRMSSLNPRMSQGEEEPLSDRQPRSSIGRQSRTSRVSTDKQTALPAISRVARVSSTSNGLGSGRAEITPKVAPSPKPIARPNKNRRGSALGKPTSSFEMHKCTVKLDCPDMTGVFVYGTKDSLVVRVVNSTVQGGLWGLEAVDEAKVETHKSNFMGNRKGGCRASPKASLTLGQNKIHDNRIGVEMEGTGALIDTEVHDNDIHGVVVRRVSGVIFRNSHIHSNKQNGVLILDQSTPLLEDCTIYDNNYQGVCVRDESNPVIKRTKVHSNKKVGILLTDRSTGTFDACEVCSNERQGILVAERSNPKLKRLKVHGNIEDGIELTDAATGYFEDCEVYENERQGCLVEESSNPVFKNLKTFENRLAGIYISDCGAGKFENCTVQSNKQDGFCIAGSACPKVTYPKLVGNKWGGIWLKDKATCTFEQVDAHDNGFLGERIGGISRCSL